MAIDPNIALSVKPVEFESPINVMAKGLALKNAQQENQMRAFQMQQQQADLARQNALRASLQGVDITSPEGLTAARNAYVNAGDIKGYHELATGQAALEKAQREAAASKLKLVSDKVDLGIKFLSGATDQPTYDAARKAMSDNGIDVSQMPPQFDPAYKQSELMKGIAAKDQLALHFADLGGSVQPVSNLTGAPVGPGLKKTLSPADRARETRESGDSVEMSPEQIDYYANLYNQTQTLPSLGMGAAPLRQKILSRAAQIGMADGASPAEGAANVVANAQTRAAEKKTLTAFTSGVEARRVTANNTAVNHLATMETLADGLANSDIRIFNSAKNVFAKATGQAAPASFDAAKQLVAAEVIKAVVNNGGGVKEREEAASQFARANSPEQLKAVIQTYKELLGGQLSSLQQQYETGAGRKDFDTKLSPRTRELLSAGTPAAGGGDLAAAARAELERRRTAK